MDTGTSMIIVGVISAVVGGLGAKLMEVKNTNKLTKIDQVEFLQLQNMGLDADLEEIREKNYELMKQNLELEAQIDKLQLQLKEN